MIPGFERNKRDGKRVPERVASGAGCGRRGFLSAAAILLIAALALVGTSTARAMTITVNNLTDPASTFKNGFCTLREAINNANSPGADTTGGDCAVDSGNGVDTIQFTPGLTGTIKLNNSSLPDIIWTLTITGPTATPPAITIDAGGKTQVMLNAGTLTLQYLTIANGDDTGGAGGADGGGMFNQGSLTISNCVFSGNQASNANGANGGAISSQGQVTITNSTFSGNQVASTASGAVASGGAISTKQYVERQQQHIFRQHGQQRPRPGLRWRYTQFARHL